MTVATLDIKAWGNNLGVRLPVAIAREAHLREHQRVQLTVDELGRIVITPIVNEALNLEQRLESFDPARHGGEAMQASQNLGAEKW
ncbi:MAG: AbrB/MazE/SpoVT family DNA-binding domain-containing protein [Gallionella sp.]|nr:AbrB/MazE/SpoVT family DNA-binding domain-containing protein [Gallionella sp.]MDD4947034.1 AbrB/MazE/SpoVT family DNA-binding domain-containing protein [Gallionella sp.]MDD5612974.1 AbrB/MazE/SpoVT family DNA-binding domain-containing protein [Gallionella sp.]